MTISHMEQLAGHGRWLLWVSPEFATLYVASRAKHSLAFFMNNFFISASLVNFAHGRTDIDP